MHTNGYHHATAPAPEPPEAAVTLARLINHAEKALEYLTQEIDEARRVAKHYALGREWQRDNTRDLEACRVGWQQLRDSMRAQFTEQFPDILAPEALLDDEDKD
jgi:hypothetical protein